MAITQPRMIALINAASDYQQALSRASEIIREAITDFQTKRLTPEEIFDSLDIQFPKSGSLDFLLLLPHTQATIKHEKDYFRRNAKRNEANARYQRRIRRERGIQPRHDASQDTFLFTDQSLEPPRAPHAEAPLLNAKPVSREEIDRLLREEEENERLILKPEVEKKPCESNP